MSSKFRVIVIASVGSLIVIGSAAVRISDWLDKRHRIATYEEQIREIEAQKFELEDFYGRCKECGRQIVLQEDINRRIKDSLLSTKGAAEMRARLAQEYSSKYGFRDGEAQRCVERLQKLREELRLSQTPDHEERSRAITQRNGFGALGEAIDDWFRVDATGHRSPRWDSSHDVAFRKACQDLDESLKKARDSLDELRHR